MYVIAPLGQNRQTITEAMLAASSVPEVAPDVWDSGDTYAEDDEEQK